MGSFTIPTDPFMGKHWHVAIDGVTASPNSIMLKALGQIAKRMEPICDEIFITLTTNELPANCRWGLSKGQLYLLFESGEYREFPTNAKGKRLVAVLDSLGIKYASTKETAAHLRKSRHFAKESISIENGRAKK